MEKKWTLIPGVAANLGQGEVVVRSFVLSFWRRKAENNDERLEPVVALIV